MLSLIHKLDEAYKISSDPDMISRMIRDPFTKPVYVMGGGITKELWDGLPPDYEMYFFNSSGWDCNKKTRRSRRKFGWYPTDSTDVYINRYMDSWWIISADYVDTIGDRPWQTYCQR